MEKVSGYFRLLGIIMKPLASHQFCKIMQKTAESLGLDYIGTHSLLKTFGYSYYKKQRIYRV